MSLKTTHTPHMLEKNSTQQPHIKKKGLILLFHFKYLLYVDVFNSNYWNNIENCYHCSLQKFSSKNCKTTKSPIKGQKSGLIRWSEFSISFQYSRNYYPVIIWELTLAI